jgi:nucleoside 2-deoxyribosyltransferase
MVVANLNPFRGAEPDSGTVFELGYGFALGKKVWGYVASSESLLERISRLDGQTGISGTPHPTDAQGLMIENFSLPLNLMLAMSAHIVTGELATCIAAIRPRNVSASPKEECL